MTNLFLRSGLLFSIPANPPAQYLTLSLRQLGFKTLETNLLIIPSAVATIITMWLIAVISEMVNDRAIVSMMEDLWILPFLIAIRALPDKPQPWLFYVRVLGISLSNPLNYILYRVLRLVCWRSPTLIPSKSRGALATLVVWLVEQSMHRYTTCLCKPRVSYPPTSIAKMMRQIVCAAWLIVIAFGLTSYLDRRGNSWLIAICAFNCFILYPSVKLYYIWQNKKRDKIWNSYTSEVCSLVLPSVEQSVFTPFNSKKRNTCRQRLTRATIALTSVLPTEDTYRCSLYLFSFYNLYFFLSLSLSVCVPMSASRTTVYYPFAK